MARQREIDREKDRKYQRAWRAANADRCREYTRKYKEANREKIRAANAKWRAENPDRVKELKQQWYLGNKEKSQASSRRSAMLRIYGITPEEADQMFEDQGRCCKICGANEPRGKGWHIDHCHTTNRVRGVLCSFCNLMLGYAQDKAATLQAAIAYLGG